MDNFRSIDGPSMIENAVKLEEAKKLFNKTFAPIRNLNIADEYVKVKLKISNLSSSKRGLVLAYVTIRRKNDPKFREVYDELDTLIEVKIKENEAKGVDTKDDFNNSKK